MATDTKPRGRSRPEQPGALTRRDLEVLEFVAEQRVAIAGQLALLMDVTEETAYRRAARLASRGLLTCKRTYHRQPSTLMITTAGLRAIDRRLPEPKPKPNEYRHDLGVGWLSVAAREGVFGAVAGVISEREMRSHDGRPGNQERPFGVGLWRTQEGRGPHSDRHYPDLVLETPQGWRLAFELELTGKSDAKLRDIMTAYAIDRRYDRVLYLVPDRRLGERIRAAARDAGAQDIVGVQLVDAGSIEGAGAIPLPGRQRSVGRERSVGSGRAVGSGRGVGRDVTVGVGVRPDRGLGVTR